MSKILVAGGTGFIGRNFVEYVSKRYPSEQIYVLSRKKIGFVIKNIQEEEVDLLDEKALQGVIEAIRPDYVLALAGWIKTERDILIADQVLEGNTRTTVKLLKSLDNVPIRKIVYLSSCEVYGQNKPPFRESQGADVFSPYAIAKYASEKFVEFFGKTHSVEYVNVRLTSAYGPFQDQTKLIPYIITQGIRGERIKLSSPQIARDYIYSEDVADGLYRTLYCKASGGIVNLGSGKKVQISRIVQHVEEILGKTLDVEYTWTARRNENPLWVCSVTKAKRDIGWNPKTDIETGLRKTVEWYAKIEEIGK